MNEFLGYAIAFVAGLFVGLKCSEASVLFWYRAAKDSMQQEKRDDQ